MVGPWGVGPVAPLSTLSDQLCVLVANFSDAALARYMLWSRDGQLPGLGVLFNTAKRWRSGASLSLQPRRAGPVIPPRGLDPMVHAAAACSVTHPLGAPPVVPHGFAFAAAGEKMLGKAVVLLRLRRLALLEKWVAADAAGQSDLAETVPVTLQRFAGRPTRVLGRILRCIGSPDVAVAEGTAHGLADWGTADESGVFPPVDVVCSPLRSVGDLVANAALRNQVLVERLRRYHPRSQALWDQGLLACSLGSLGPDIPVAELPRDSVACLKFGVVQHGPGGVADVRACADMSVGQAGNGDNALWSSAEKVVMSDADTVLAEIALMVRLHGLPLRGRKRDLRKAYWQAPRASSGPCVYMLFWCPRRKEVRARLQISQDFGSAGAVHCCNRVFRCLAFVLQYWFLVPCDNYFDDYWLFTAPWSVESASFVVDRAVHLLGYVWKDVKNEDDMPLPLLGLSFDVGPAGVTCENKASRKASLAAHLAQIRERPPDEVSLGSPVGKLVFADKGLSGRAGVHARRPLHSAAKHMVEIRLSRQWPMEVKKALDVVAGTVALGRQRTFSLTQWGAPLAVIYGDAALSTRRMGAILWRPSSNSPAIAGGRAFSVEVPSEFLASLSPDPGASGTDFHCINGFEAYWVQRACEHWLEELKGHLVLIINDNMSAVRGFINGYSGSQAVCDIVGQTWRMWIDEQMTVWCEWVHTHSNPADALTRPGWAEAAARMGVTLEEVPWHSQRVCLL